MPWRKIAKVVGAIVIGGGIGSGGIPEGSLVIPPDLMNTINTVLGAVVTLILTLVRSPRDE